MLKKILKTTGTGFQRETVGTVETTGQPAAGNPGTATPAQGAQNDQNNQAGGAQTGTPNNAQYWCTCSN